MQPPLTGGKPLQLRVAADANYAGMVDLRIPVRHQNHERHFGISLRGTAGPSCQTRLRDNEETRDRHRATQG